MAQLYWVELSLTSHHTQVWSYRVLLPPTSTAAAAHTLNCLYMGVYYTSVKQTQQLSGVTRIRTHDLLIRHLITKQWRPVLSQLGHHPNPKKSWFNGSAVLGWTRLDPPPHSYLVYICLTLLHSGVSCSWKIALLISIYICLTLLQPVVPVCERLQQNQPRAVTAAINPTAP